MSHPCCLRADPSLPFGKIIPASVDLAETVVSAGGNVWSYVSSNYVSFGYSRDFKPALDVYMAALKEPQPDPQSLARVLRHPKTTLVTDMPRRLVRVTFHEAELLTSWNCPVTVWGSRAAQTFWCRPEDFPPLQTLREVRKEEA
jgi:hypothetical protein